MKHCIFTTLLIGSCFIASAQDFGGFPTRTKWKQINTDTARIIFNPKSEIEAERVATILHRMAATTNPLGNKLNKINIVLHGNTTLANGYVGLAPFRSEFYLIPAGNIFQFGNLPWAEQLAIHEYRHVQQYNNFNRGISKGLGVVFGEEGRAVANALSIPDWFFEGDAVYAETVLTPQGRGRMPYFMNGYKSLWSEGKDYSWMKLRNGSLKDYVPNHYQLGYLLVNYGYLKYGEDFWRKVTEDASSYRGLFYPFQQAVKRHSGLDFKKFRREALNYYKHETSKRRDDTTAKGTVTNYLFPQEIGNDSLLYLKNSYKELPAFYLRHNNQERRIALRNVTSEDWFSYRNGTIAYTSLHVHPRWTLIDYSDIILLDIATGKEEKITEKGKYFTPDISPDNANLVATYINDSLQSEIHILSKNGELIKKIEAPAHSFFIQPQYIDANNIVVGLRWPDATITLERMNITDVSFDRLLPPTKATIGYPSVNNGHVYFVSSLSGNDDIYVLRLKDKKLFQITAGKTGRYFPSVFHDTLTFSLFTTLGLRIQQQNLQKQSWAEINPIQLGEEVAPFIVANENETTNILATPTKDYNITDYKKATGLFNFHSWRPFYERPEFSLSLYSNNILNTFSNELFYRYNENERSSTVGFNTAYGGWFPFINAGVEYTFNRQLRTVNETRTMSQALAYLGYSIPLNSTSGNTFKRANVGSNFVFYYSPNGIFGDSLIANTASFLHHFITFTQQLPRARLHIFPKFGWATNLQYRHHYDKDGFQMLALGQLFLPTPFATHSLVVDGGIQETDTSNVIFGNRFAGSRGYNNFFFTRIWRASGNYHLPLVYPDLGFANLVYFMRVRANVFYDFTKVYSRSKTITRNLRSIGGEVVFDTKWWNQLPVSFGVRISHLLDDDLSGSRPAGSNQFEFILPINLIPN